MTDGPVRVELPEVVLRTLRAVVADGSLTPQQRMESVIVSVFGGLWWSTQDDVDGRRWAIPERQWEEIAGWMLSLTPSTDVDRTNYALTWMNLGPSGYVEERAG
jgi:hypothetical protein